MADESVLMSARQSSNVHTVSQTIVPPPDPAPTGWWRRYWWLAPVALVVALAAASLIAVPYYRVTPGSAEGLTDRVVVADGPSYPPAGEVYLLTARVGRVTALGAFLGWLDPDTDVFEDSAIRPRDVDPDDLREFNLELMATAKQTAVAVAHEELGFDVVSGTGAEVTAVPAGSPADGHVRVGDTIVAVAGEPVEEDTDAVALIGVHEPGDTVTLGLEAEDGTRREEELTLGPHPEDAGRPYVGVQLRTKDASLELAYDVEIDSEDIGGPSGGLALTLQILDVLTPGELTGGHRVAATGTIGLGGRVGLVGGVRQKMVAVKEADIDLFLVPSGEVEEARALAGDGLRVEPVDTLDDALRILAGVGGNGQTLDRSGVQPA